MIRYVAAVALAVAAFGSLATPASALVECQELDVQCYRTCYLPQYEKGKDIYWYNC